MFEMYGKIFILILGWPFLILMSVAIIQKAYGFYNKLQKTILGQLILPTVFGWLFGMFALGIVATSYMYEVTWYYTVIPVFLSFFAAIIMVFITMEKWEKEAVQLQSFYTNLEKLVKERTAALEEAHVKAIAHEKEIQVLKDQFVFIAAHELRTPVTAIKWGLEMVIDEGPSKIGKDLFEQLLSVQNSNDRLIGLVEDLLNVARIESKTIKIVTTHCNASEIIHQLIDEQKPFAEKSKIKVIPDIPIDVTLQSDPLRLKQIFTNLLSNAIKYNREKGTVDVVLSHTSDTISLVVKDSGIGISEHDLPILFTKFGRIRTKETENIEGTGLGLFVTKELVQQLGGTIVATSTVGKGSTFTVVLPKNIKSTK